MIKGLRVIESMWFDNVGIVKTDSDLGIKYYIGYRKNHQDIPQAEKIIAYKGTEVSLPLLKIFLDYLIGTISTLKRLARAL